MYVQRHLFWSVCSFSNRTSQYVLVCDIFTSLRDDEMNEKGFENSENEFGKKNNSDKVSRDKRKMHALLDDFFFKKRLISDDRKNHGSRHNGKDISRR